VYTSVGIGTMVLATTLVLFNHRGGPAKTNNAPRIQEVVAAVETEPVSTGGDSADDPTLWVNPSDAQQSLVIGTNKKRGLAVYDLAGKEIQFLADGQMNNVDHRDDFPLDGKMVPLVTASNRSQNSIAIYKIDVETRRLESVAAGVIKTIEAYGSCMYRSNKTGKFYYLVTSKLGLVEQYELLDAGKGVSAKRVRQIKVGGQLEGCVADAVGGGPAPRQYQRALDVPSIAFRQFEMVDVRAIDRQARSHLLQRLRELGEPHVPRLPVAGRERAEMMGERPEVSAEQLLDHQLVRLVADLGER